MYLFTAALISLVTASHAVSDVALHHGHRGPVNCDVSAQMIISSNAGNVPNTGPGAISELTALFQQIQNVIPNTGYHPIRYSKADWSSDPVGTATKGAAHFRNYMRHYSSACPKVPLIVLSYSEGALIAMNGLCGRSHIGSPDQKPLAEKYGRRTAAVISYGNPSYVSGLHWDRSTCTNGTGVNPRQTPSNCDSFGHAIEDYCQVGDPVCCKGDDGSSHSNYQNIYTPQSLQWVLQKYYRMRKPHTIKKYYNIGCYQGYLLPDKSTVIPDNSPAACAEFCKGYNYFALQGGAAGNSCSCTSTIQSNWYSVSSGSCNTPCPDNPKMMCGGSQYMNLYHKAHWGDKKHHKKHHHKNHPSQ